MAQQFRLVKYNSLPRWVIMDYDNPWVIMGILWAMPQFQSHLLRYDENKNTNHAVPCRCSWLVSGDLAVWRETGNDTHEKNIQV